MARRPRWEELDIKDGVGEVRVFSWRYFYEYINQEMLDFRHYIWRGQRCDDWLLSPTLDRRLAKLTPARAKAARADQLENFKFAVRGRRGRNPSRLSIDEWWALGQHHGLDTPLLDWTSSPFAAAYFAFYGTGSNQTRRRAIYALHPHALEEAPSKTESSASVRVIRPFSDDNPRLVNQGGMFTRAPDGIDLESWIRRQHPGVDDE